MTSDRPMDTETERSRWQKRFEHFAQAFARLESAIPRVDPTHLDEADDLIVAGLIQTYAFTMELGWKTMKDYLYEKGDTLVGSKEVMKKAFQEGLITDGHAWMQAIEDRNLLAHTYDQEATAEIVEKIHATYFKMLKELRDFFEKVHDK